jgi:hypothetical protein
MSAFNLLLAAIICYIPYQLHFPIVFDLKGLNFINLLFLVALIITVIARRAHSAATQPTRQFGTGSAVSDTPKIPIKWSLLFFIAMIFWAFLMAQFSSSNRLADDLTVLKTNIFYPLFFFLIYYAVRDRKSTRFLFGVILFVAAVVSVHAIRQGLDYGLATFEDTRRASGPFAPDYRGANLAAAFFIIFVPVFVTVLLQKRESISIRALALLGAALGLFGVFVTYSRQAYFILAALILMQTLRRNIAIGLVVLLAVVTYESWAPETVVARLDTTTEQINSASGEQVLDKSTASRFVLWEGAAKLIAERPLGIGLNRFRSEIGRHVPEYANYDAHNGYVLTATEAGIFAPIIIVILLFCLFRLGYKVYRLDDSRDSAMYGSALMIATLGFACANLFGSRFFNGEVVGNYWILAALVARYYILRQQELQQSVSTFSDTGIVRGATRASVQS